MQMLLLDASAAGFHDHVDDDDCYQSNLAYGHWHRTQLCFAEFTSSYHQPVF